MRQFKFNKPIVESSTPPRDTDVLWAEIDENSGILVSLSEFIGGRWVVTHIANITDLINTYVYPSGDIPITVPYYGTDNNGHIVGALSEASKTEDDYDTVISHIDTQTNVLDGAVSDLGDIIESLDETNDAALILALTTIKANVNSASTILKADIPPIS